MKEPQNLATFDKAERAAVQRALRRYMEEHSIGTPTLQVRIIEADEPRHREIPLSTLQRFLAGSHHTNDHHVSLCREFVKELPYFSEEYDLSSFGNAAAAFFRARQGEGEIQIKSDALTGEFNLTLHHRGRRTEIGLASPDEAYSNFETSYSAVVLDPAPDGTHHGVRERVFNPYLVDNWRTQVQPSYLYEGVAFMTSDTTAVAFQRDMLTRQPRTSYLTCAPNPSEVFPTLYYVQVIWLPFLSHPVAGEPLAQTIEELHLTSAADDDRRWKELSEALQSGLRENE